MPYQMKDASYDEYKKYCAVQGLRPVRQEEYTFAFWVAFCKEQQIPNALRGTQ